MTHVRQDDALASRFLVILADQNGLLGNGEDTGAVTVDIGDTIIEVHGYQKRGAGFGYSGIRGLNALLATVATDTYAPVIAVQRLRKGSWRSSGERDAYNSCELRRVQEQLASFTLDRIRPTAITHIRHSYATAVVGTVAAMSVDITLHPAETRQFERPVLDIVVPVFNEEVDLEPSVRRLQAHLTAQFPYPFRITIADNASSDATTQIATRLAAELPRVSALRLAKKGRGGALRMAWSASDADVLAYCDVDLSTDLAALLPLVAPLISGHSYLAIGTRLGRGARVVRGAKREFISRSYNLLLRSTLGAGFSDAQCGFKAIRADVARRLLPLVEDTGGFFDTELLVLAERTGLRIHEVPVDWVDDPDSRVDIVATAVADLKGIARLGRALATDRLPLAQLRGQLGRDAPPPDPVAAYRAACPAKS